MPNWSPSVSKAIAIIVLLGLVFLSLTGQFSLVWAAVGLGFLAIALLAP